MTDETQNDLFEQPPEPTPVARSLVAYQAHAFSSFTEITERPEGQTVAEMVASLNFPADYDGFVHVWINDLPLDRDQWEHVIPAEGQMIYVRVIPQGGGSGKDILRTVATIAIAVVAFYYAPVLMGFQAGTAGWAAASAAGFGSYLAVAGISAGIAILGNMALNAIIPPPKLELDFGNGLGSQKNQLTGSSNRFAPYAPIPRVFGKRRMYPLLAGRPYSETQGDDEYLRMALLVGWGPLRITDIRIGETPISSFSEVEIEVREGFANDAALTLYTNTISEASYSILLEPSVANSRTSDTGVTEITVDVTAPAGLAKFENDGKRSSIDVDVEVRYSVAGQNNWQTPTWLNSTDTGLSVNGRIRLSGADTSAIRRTGRFSVPAGQYDVRLTRTTSTYDTTKHVQEVRWTTMRSIKPSYPVQQSGLALIALRMKATGQLNGIPQTINCLAESYLPVYSGGAWSYQITRNPAWAFADILRRRGGQTYLSDDRIDLTTISAWAAACDATAPNANEPYWTFDGVVEGGTVFQVLRQIAASARANYTVRDGKHSVVRDVLQTVPIQHITPRNSFGYSGNKVFLDYPHALRVVFVNAAKNFEEDERIVYDDGYNAGNATKFETLELFGCTSATQAYREGRYFIAAARLRPETHVVSMDVENLRCTIGDLVQFQHDVVSIGIAAARVVSIAGSVITLDQQFSTSAGTSYALRMRLSNGDTLVVSLQSPGTTTTATFTATSSTAGIAAGDLAMFGVSTSVTAPMLVKKIEPGPDFTARVHLVDAQAGVWTADTGVIPAFNSNITTTQPIENQRPTAPTIFDVRSDDAVALLLADGTLQVRMSVIVSPPASSLLRVDYYDVQWKEAAADNYNEVRFAKGSPIYLSPVQVGVSYQIRVRGVSEYGVAGDWSTVFTHTVTGKTGAPGNVLNLTATLKTGAVVLSWTAATDADYDSTELRYGATWAAGTFLWRGAASTWSWNRPANATYKVWAAHRNSSGNYSATPASVDITVTNAVDPERTVLLTIYQRYPASPTPSLPSVNATYDFSTNTLSGLNNGWSVTAPAGSDPLWVSTATTTGNLTDTIPPGEWSAATILLQNGTAGLTTAVVELFQRTATNSAPAVSTGGSATYTFASGAITGQPAGWLTAVPSSGGGYLWVIRATAASTGATDTIANTEWTAPALLAQDGANGTNGTNGTNGANGTQAAVVYMYQWSSSEPSTPYGYTTYTWASASHSGYTANDGWSVSVPANPGTPGVRLWVASKSITDSATAISTTVTWTFSTVAAWSQNGANGANGANGTNGANGVQSAEPTVYRWDITIPAGPSGGAYYTWATGAISSIPAGWSATPGTAPSPGYTLWGAAVKVVDSAANASTFFNWSTASITARGYSGTNGANGTNGTNGTQGAQGASSRICYARIPNNPAPVSGTIPVSGDNVPTATDSANYWGIFVAWSTTDPNPSSTSTLYQSDGIYNPVTNVTNWSTPYISSLKVGTLSAITVNTGDLTINGTLTVASGGAVQSQNYSPGSTGWGIFPGGVAEFRNITARGNIEATSLQVGSAMVATLNINGSAVTVPIYGSSFVSYGSFDTYWSQVLSVTVPVTGLQAGEAIGLIVNSVSSIYPADGTSTDVVLGIFINGNLVTELAASISGYGFSHAGSGYALVGNGNNIVDFKYRTNVAKTMTIATYATALAGKR